LEKALERREERERDERGLRGEWLAVGREKEREVGRGGGRVR
jgi:hypothetical protein